MTRRRWLIAAAVAVAGTGLAWLLMTQLSRVLQTTALPASNATPSQPVPQTSTVAVPRIKAMLYFASADGRRLVPAEQDVPLGEGTVAQARALIEAQLAAIPPPPLTSSIPPGTTLRGLFVSTRREAFVDLDASLRDKHPGGSLNELLTVYTIVHAITSNLQDVQQVQLLIDGREVDTLAGHVDLRRPLRKNDLLVTP